MILKIQGVEYSTPRPTVLEFNLERLDVLVGVLTGHRDQYKKAERALLESADLAVQETATEQMITSIEMVDKLQKQILMRVERWVGAQDNLGPTFRALPAESRDDFLMEVLAALRESLLPADTVKN